MFRRDSQEVTLTGLQTGCNSVTSLLTDAGSSALKPGPSSDHLRAFNSYDWITEPVVTTTAAVALADNADDDYLRPSTFCDYDRVRMIDGDNCSVKYANKY